MECACCLNKLNECTQGPKVHLTSFRSLHGMSTFKSFKEIIVPSKCTKEGIKKIARLVRHSNSTTWTSIAAQQKDDYPIQMGEEGLCQNSATYSSVDAMLQHLGNVRNVPFS